MRMSSSSLMATKMTTRSSQSNRQLPRVLLALCCFISLLATAHADICQCGPRCAGYEVVDLCARCCTSVMRRRSVPWQSYPAEQLEGTQKRSSSPVRSDAIDAQILASIVEETAATMADEQQKKRENREGEVKQPQMEFEEEQPQMKGVDRRLDLTAFETQRHALAKRFPRSSAQQQVMEWRRRIAAEAAAEVQEQAQQQRRKRAIEPSNFFGQEQAER